MKLLVFDVEGTIFKADYKIEGTDYASTMWQPLAHVLGEAAIAEEKETHVKWESKGYDNYLKWVEESIGIHKKYSLKKETFYELIEKADYNVGVVEFFKNLDRDKYIPVLVSGGFQELIRRAQIELGIDYGFGACEYYFDDEGYLDHYNLQPTDFNGKFNFIKLLFSQFNINNEKDWVFIGDGKNDVDIAKKAPLAFGINTHPELLKVDGIIEIESFSEIIPFMESYTERKVKEPIDMMEESKYLETDIELLEENRVNSLEKQVYDLKKELKNLKQQHNDLLGKSNRKKKTEEFAVSKIDYTNTPKKSLKEILSEYKVVFVGLKKEYRSIQYLEQYYRELRIIEWQDKGFDTTPIENADFMFIYKNCIAHATTNRIFKKKTPPYARLKNHSNEEFLENVMANVLYRYFYE